MSKYASLACMFKNLDQNASNQITDVFIFHIWTLSSISGQRSKQYLEKLSEHLFTMKFWLVFSLFAQAIVAVVVSSFVSIFHLNILGFQSLSLRLDTLSIAKRGASQVAIYGLVHR